MSMTANEVAKKMEQIQRDVEARNLKNLKTNLIEVVKFHKSKCDSTTDCCCSLGMLKELAELAGITFTDEEKANFC